MNSYDYIIAGAGCAGLSLLWRMSRSSSLRDRRILVVDKAPKKENDRTWCFWTSEPTPFDSIIAHRWDRLAFWDDDGQRASDLGAYQYQLLRAIDFYRFTQSALQSMPRVHTRYGHIQDVGEDERGAYMLLEGEKVRASHIFDSRYLPPKRSDAQRGAPQLLQHFLGWTIRANRDVFDPTTPVLMDFREEQSDHAHFYYLLPFSEREALVELTFFSPAVWSKATYREKLNRYLSHYWKLADFETIEEEFGVIPMQGGPAQTSGLAGVTRLGTLGGAVKPTTGYAFLRIQEQADLLADQLVSGQPPALPPWRFDRFAFYDHLLLHILTEEGRLGKAIFSQLFRHNPMDRILTFLNEDSHLLQEALLFSTLPKVPFFKAIWALYGATGMKAWTERNPIPG